MSVHRLKSVLAVYGPGLGRTVAKARGPSAEFETYFVVSGKHTLWLWNVETVLSRWIERGRYPRTSHDTHSRQNGTISENCARHFMIFIFFLHQVLFRDRKTFCVSSARFEVALREFCSAIFEVRRRALFCRFLSFCIRPSQQNSPAVYEKSKSNHDLPSLGPSLI